MSLSRVPVYHFTTQNVTRMIRGALDTAIDAEEEIGATEVQILVAVNDLRHAAAELERSLLEQKHGIPGRH